MTTGTKILGSTNTPTYFYKNWSGNDSPTYVVSAVVKLKKWRTMRDKPRPFFRVSANGKHYKYVMLPATWDHHEKYITIKTRNRILMENPYSMLGRQGVNTPGSGGYLSLNLSYAINPYWDSNDDLALLAKLSTAVRGHSFNLGIAAAELPKTLALVLTTVTRFTSAIRALKKGRFDLALRHLGSPPPPKEFKHFQGGVHRNRDPRTLRHEDIGAMWLEIQYGWRPLIQDVYEAVSAVAATADKARKSSLQVKHNRSKTQDNSWSPYYSASVLSRGSKRIKYTMTERLSTGRSLGLADPRPIVWEIIPFSFVADWFIPIGTYLDCLATIPFLDGTFVTTYRQYDVGSCVGKQGNAGARNSCTSTTLVRSVSTSISVPKPQFKPLSTALSPGHIKNAIALLQVTVASGVASAVKGRHSYTE